MDKTRAQTLSEQEKVFTQYSVPKVLAKFILPAALSQLTFLILNLADAFFVGRTGDTFQISAMTITFPIVMILTLSGGRVKDFRSWDCRCGCIECYP